MIDVKRKTELWICAQSAGHIDFPIFPTNGGDKFTEATFPEPPYAVVEVGSAEKLIQDESTWKLEVFVKYITHIDESDVNERETDVRALHQILGTLPYGEYNSAFDLIIHGCNITGTDTFIDDTKQSHGDVWTLDVFVTG